MSKTGCLVLKLFRNPFVLLAMFGGLVFSMVSAECEHAHRKLPMEPPASEWSPKATPIVQQTAVPFSPYDVRLLGGPLRESQDTHARYLISLSADRLLARFRAEAGLTPKAQAYPGWEANELPGVAAGFYLSGCSRLWAGTGDHRFLDRIEYCLEQLRECQTANGNGYLLATKGGKRIFEEIEHGDIRYTGGWLMNGQPEPYYAMEKLLSGLRDAYRIGHQRLALQIERGMVDWLSRHMSHLTDPQLQQIMACEFGGINWALADLYADTGDPRYLAMSRRWQHHAILDPLSRGIDILPGNHANTQFPKISGLAARYPFTGDTSDRVTSEFFWNRVAHHHSYATGSNSLAEHFGAPDHLADRLGPATGENCNAWNMIRLTGLLYEIQPREEYADYIERVLFNHILAAQHPADGRVCYFLSLESGGSKVYEPLFDRFACCTCSGFDSYARHSEWIYAYGGDCLYVNLFVPSSVRWRAMGVSFLQKTRFPSDGSTQFTIQSRKPVRLRLAIRCPRWTDEGFQVALNGRALEIGAMPGSYVTIDRIWHNGDLINVRLPMPIRTEEMPDDRQKVALFRGPILLAGNLGTGDRFSAVPTLIDDGKPAERSVSVTAGEMTVQSVPLQPLYQVHDAKYVVYWDRLTPRQQADRRRDEAETSARLKALDDQTIDRVIVGSSESESSHRLAGSETHTGFGAYDEHLETRWRDAAGWFSYTLDCGVSGPRVLRATYWGHETGQRVFDVLVDGTVVATTTLNSEHLPAFYDVVYAVPDALLQGKSSITVTFKAHSGNTAGGLFGLRLMRTAKP